MSWPAVTPPCPLPTVPGMPLPVAVPALLVFGPWLPGFWPRPPVGIVAAPLPGAARLADVTLSPDPSALPGGQVLQHLMDGLGGWALVLALAGLVIGAAAWALGSHGSNYQQSYVGRRAVLVSGLAALLIGAGPAIVNFFFAAGRSVH